MRYGIAMFPSKEFQDRVNSYRKRYDPHYALIPPHITLMDPYELNSKKVATATKWIRDIAADIGPIQILVDKVSSFHPVNNVIYLKVESTPNLIKLQSELSQGEFGCNHEYNFEPHITIAQDLSDIEHVDVLERMKMLEFHHSEMVDRFQLLYQLDNGSWKVHETFHLGGGKA